MSKIKAMVHNDYVIKRFPHFQQILQKNVIRECPCGSGSWQVYQNLRRAMLCSLDRFNAVLCSPHHSYNPLLEFLSQSDLHLNVSGSVAIQILCMRDYSQITKLGDQKMTSQPPVQLAECKRKEWCTRHMQLMWMDQWSRLTAQLKPWAYLDCTRKKSIAEKCPCLVKGCENIPRTRLHIPSDCVCHLSQSMFPDNVSNHTAYVLYLIT